MQSIFRAQSLPFSLQANQHIVTVVAKIVKPTFLFRLNTFDDDVNDYDNDKCDGIENVEFCLFVFV